jgi:hypothetical protein
MSNFFKLARFALLPLAIALSTAGCHKDPALVLADNNQAGTQDPGSDPAAANLPPVPDNSGAPQYQSSPDPGYQQGAPPQGQSVYDPGYGQQPEYTDSQPPPPLPEYDQPPAPGDGYLWTPGYWAWSDGYYWVPGAWVEAPYEGALWTPGYWGYWNNSYGFYPGYWGQYIGYYGGIDYGFGYGGYGYQGGYWGGGHFNYNRSVNNINISVVHNVYSHSEGGNTNNSRVSFNGGSGGVRAQARPQELAAMHQQHTAPMSAQMQNQRAAGANRAQFASANHGRPANVAVNQPLAADRNVRAPAALETTTRNVEQQQQRQGAPQQQQRQEGPQQQQHQAAPQPQERQAAPQPQERQAAPQPQQHQAELQHQSAPQQQQRQAAPQQRQATPQPQQHQAAPQPQQHQAAAQPQHQAAPQQQQRQAAPQQQPRQAAPQQRQATPQPQQHQAAPKPQDQHPK